MRLFALTAAALLLTGSAALAAPSESELYAKRATARAQDLLRRTGVDFTAQPVSVRAAVDVDGSLRNLRVVSSSGSPAADRAAEAVLRRIITADPPAGLTDGAVILNIGGAPTSVARAGGR